MSADHGKYNSIFTLTVDTAIKILSLGQVSDSLEINSPYIHYSTDVGRQPHRWRIKHLHTGISFL